MTALDLSPYTPDSDSEDVAAYKAKVLEDLNKVRSATLDKRTVKALLGIDTDPVLTLDVITTHPFQFTVKTAVSVLKDLDEAGQKTKVADLIGTISLTSAGAGAGGLRILPEAIQSMTITGSDNPTVVGEPPRGYIWFYPQSDSRVQHLVPTDRDTNNAHHGGHSVCGRAMAYSYTHQRTPRGDHQRCKTCTTRLPGLTARF